MAGDKCGSTFIDKAFKQWLQSYIGERHYKQLDNGSDMENISSHTTEGKAMRQLMKAFEVRKQNFSKTSGDVYLDLPEPLHYLNIRGKVDEGQITLTKYVYIYE